MTNSVTNFELENDSAYFVTNDDVENTEQISWHTLSLSSLDDGCNIFALKEKWTKPLNTEAEKGLKLSGLGRGFVSR